MSEQVVVPKVVVLLAPVVVVMRPVVEPETVKLPFEVKLVLPVTFNTALKTPDVIKVALPLALIVANPTEDVVVPEAWAMLPPVLTMVVVPVVDRLPITMPPVVSVMLVLPPTVTLPAVPWLKLLFTVKLPASQVVPPVCVKLSDAKLPVPLKLPALWL